MNLIVFFLSYPFLILVSILPLRISYLISDFIYLILYYFIGYRKKVVQKNLILAFPNLSDAERKIIEKKSFKHFVDIFIEMAKTFTISKNQIKKRYQISGMHLFEEALKNNQSVLLMSAHYANWEWSIILSDLVPEGMIPYMTYTKIKNPYFNELIKKSRARFGGTPLEAKETVPQIVQNARKKIPSAFGLISDQSPSYKQVTHFESFFGHQVPVHMGAEVLARKFNHTVLYLDTQMVKRGYYKSEIKSISKNPQEMPVNGIIKKYIDLTETQIKRDPSLYFWTHNRFKHKDRFELLKSKK